MKSKLNTCDTPVIKSKQLGQKSVALSPSNKVVLLRQGDTLEITIKQEDRTKEQKRTPPIISPEHGQKAEKKRSMINDGEPRQSWSGVFAKQNLVYMKQTQSAKCSENKEIRKHLDNKRQQTRMHNHMDPVLSKKSPCPKKLSDNSKSPCCQSVFVQDRAVQHPDTADHANRFAEVNPTNTLSSLIKELKDLVKNDKRTSEIFTEVDQLLLKVSVNSGKSLEFEHENVETKLQASNMLQHAGEKIKVMCESWISKQKDLHSHIHKQDVELKKATKRQSDLESEIKMLKEQSEDAQMAKDKLRQQVEKNELLNKLISNLRTELANQTEFAHKYYIDNQCLKIDRDKHLQLSVYKDTLITQYQRTIKELQTQVAEQLKALSEARANEESSQISLTQTGFVCSSPTSSFLDRSNKSWQDLSDVSSVPPGYTLSKENVPIKDLKLVSLELDGESSRDMFDSCRNRVADGKGTFLQNNHDDTVNRDGSTKNVRTKKSLHQSPKKNRDNDVYETTKESSSDNIKHSFYCDVLKIPTNIAPIDVPSPLRKYPDLSDSTLSSVSTAPDLDMVPSNDI